MRASLLPVVLAVASLTLTFARSARAADSECPVSQLGQACGGSDVCIAATCCDDPNGCAFDAGSVGSGSGSSGAGSSSSGSSGGTTATGVSRACGLCTFIAETYCAPADEGKACPSGGTCQWSGGGAETVTEPDGGTTHVSFDISGCGPSDLGDDGGGSGGGGGGSTSGSSSGTNGGASGGGFGGSSSSGSSSGSSGGGTSGSSGSSSSGSSGASSGSSGASSGSGGSGEATSDGGTGKGTTTASCAIGPRGTPWGALPFVALGLVAIARRRRSVS